MLFPTSASGLVEKLLAWRVYYGSLSFTALSPVLSLVQTFPCCMYCSQVNGIFILQGTRVLRLAAEHGNVDGWASVVKALREELSAEQVQIISR